MPVLADVVTRYNRLMEQNGFGESAWAEALQQRMREQRLTDSGRLLSPVLRPCFVTPKQVDSLTKIASQFSVILDTLEALFIAKPGLLSRLQMLPAEKSLLIADPGYKHFSMAASIDVAFPGANCVISGVDASRAYGLAYASGLTELFLDSPVVKEFKRNSQKVSKVPATRRLVQSLTAAWHQFGGKGKPSVAVVDWANTNDEGISEGELLSVLLVGQGLDSKFVPPEKLVLENGVLRSGDRKIDLVLRRILARDLVTRYELTHPLLEAYRSHAVCVVNSFRAEIGQRRAFLELLTDPNITDHLTAPERKLLKQSVRWTRIVSARKTMHEGQEVDLLEWTLKNREHLTLLPDRPAPDVRTYAGSEMTAVAWEYAVKQALRTPYVIQESSPATGETFPFYQYGEFKMRQVDVTVQAQLLAGELGDCTAVLHARAAGSVTPLGIAPVLMVS
jgi:hypothetical protein